MSVTVKKNATLSGGTDVVLSSSGFSPGKSTFVTPTSSRLAPQTFEFTTNAVAPTNKDPGVARSNLRTALASRTTEEGCCTAVAGAIVIQTNGSWNLNQDIVTAELAWDLHVAAVQTAAAKDAFLKGLLPQ